MKINNFITAWLLSGALLGSICSANAISLTVGMTDPLSVGQVVNHLTGGSFASRTAAEINAVIPLPLGGTALIDGETATRSGNVFASLPSATTTGAHLYSDGGGLNNVGSTVVLTVPVGGYTYLVAAYDGPNGGVEIYNISSLTGGTEIILPRYAEPNSEGLLVESTRYQMTGWALLNPGGGDDDDDDDGGTGVPDAGASLMLLGLALVGVESVRRRLK